MIEQQKPAQVLKIHAVPKIVPFEDILVIDLVSFTSEEDQTKSVAVQLDRGIQKLSLVYRNCTPEEGADIAEKAARYVTTFAGK